MIDMQKQTLRCDGATVFNTDLSFDLCNRLCNYLMSKKYSYSTKSIKEYIQNNMTYSITLNANKEAQTDNIKVYTKDIYQVKYPDSTLSSMIVLYSNKEKLLAHAFPSSYDIHDVKYISRLTFRINNRVFVNIDNYTSLDCGHTSVKEENDTINRSLFINVNLGANLDHQYIEAELYPLLCDLNAVAQQASTF